MLREISIKNFAIIDDLTIRFSSGLTILSGETGAGKSIIINAVNLLLGSRASSKLVRTGAETAELEAFFDINGKSGLIGKIAETHGYDLSEGILIKRIISRKDRHRIYINGHMTTINVLKLITENLASISSQHSHHGILKEGEQLDILDQFGNLLELREKTYTCFHQIIPLLQELNALVIKEKQHAEHVALLEFQKKEILAAAVLPEEDAALEKERQLLKNGEKLYQSVNQCIETLYSSRGAVVEHLIELGKDLEKASLIDPKLSPKADSIAETALHLEDLVDELRKYLDHVQIDDRRLEEIESRLDALHKLKRKYGGSLESVKFFLESIGRELSEIENISGKIDKIKDKITGLQSRLAGYANALSEKREKSAGLFSERMEKELGSLKMSSTKFLVSLQSVSADDNTDPILMTQGKAIRETGVDQATFMIAPNRGEDIKPLAGIASGGELSRIVLAIKAILAREESVELLVFDEVDAGIGGSVAEVVGRKLHSLAQHHQVICITHLPQIAKYAAYHYRIEKKVSKGRTVTTIKPVTKKDRVKEIARMLGGEKITQTTMEHAREILSSA